MIHPKPSMRRPRTAWNWKMWGGPLLAGVMVIGGCKNTPQGPVPIWNAPSNTTAPQGDPLFGPANSPPTAPLTGSPGAPGAPAGSPMLSSIGNSVGAPPPSGPLPGMHSPATMSSPAALATGTSGQLNNPRDPYSTQPPVPTFAAPVPNPNAPAGSQPGAIQLRQPEVAPGANWSPAPNNTFSPGGAPPPSPPPGSLAPTAGLIDQGQNSLTSMQNNLNKTVTQSQQDLNNMANSANNTANQYKQNLTNTQQQLNTQANQLQNNFNNSLNNTQQQLANQGNQIQNNFVNSLNTSQQQLANQGNQIQNSLNNNVASSMDRLKSQLAQQGQAVDGAMQSTLTSLDESLRRQGMVWQNMQKQVDGTWKSTASFADPNNPANRRTMEVVANTPDAAMRALLGEASGAPKAPATAFTTGNTGVVGGGFPAPLPPR